MKLNHLTCWVSLFVVITGCSGLKAYPDREEKNLLVRTNASGSMFMSVKALLHFYTVQGDCKKDYLGTTKLKNGETLVGVAVGKPSYLRIAFEHGNAWLAHDFIFTPRPGVRYIADVSYVDRIYNVSLHEAGAGGKPGRVIERQSRNCPD